MATNLQEAARRMYSAKGFTDYGKILGAGLKEAVRDIAIAREQEEKEAKAERKQRDAFALDLYAKRPSINEGAVPPEMLSVVKNWLLDTRNQYNEATQNLSGDISDPSYRAAIDMANKTKTSYANLSSQMQMFKENQKEYLETVGTTDFSNSNSQTDINLVSSIYNKDFSNFTIDDNGKVVLETSQGIKTLDEINELFNSLNPKTPKQTQGLSKITNQGKKNGMDGYELTESDFNDISADLGMLFADKKNTISYIFDNPGAKQFISNSFKLEDGSFPDEKMDIADKKDGIIDDEWLRNHENYDLIYDKVIEHGIDLAKRSNQEGLSRYNIKQNENKKGLDFSVPLDTVSGIRKSSMERGMLGPTLLPGSDTLNSKKFVQRLQDEYNTGTTYISTFDEMVRFKFEEQLKNKQSEYAKEYDEADTEEEKMEIENEFKKDFKERYPDAKFFSIRSGRLSPFNKDINNDNDIVDFLYSRNILNKAALYR